jgi:hypothetical protein
LEKKLATFLHTCITGLSLICHVGEWFQRAWANDIILKHVLLQGLSPYEVVNNVLNDGFIIQEYGRTIGGCINQITPEGEVISSF